MDPTPVIGAVLLAAGICLVLVGVVREVGTTRALGWQTLATIAAGVALLLGGQWLIQ
ncbi:hypothetical protein KUV85_13020 [Nocardioides panacisoli]|uniref:hypothetical protein n=1 Tax=Nocardioides panacisoli TaxID=627624 RepID=UPI001C63AB51|nr:hypothetical protein [Nocardioides panacisoli]QYJ03251.1 hypothetical protein KUV85_13020 [Nocardioides panacisoli]